MAQRCVALLRGVNVGGPGRRVPMAELRDLVEAQGHREVRTLLNSGNVVFTTSRITASLPLRLRSAIYDRLGVDTRVTVLSAAEVTEIIERNPLGGIATEPRRLLVSVLADPSDRALLLPLTRERWTPEVIALGRRAGYLWLADGFADSRVAKAVERTLGDRQTARNWATMLKLYALVTGPG